MNKIGILGTGSWGTALSILAGEKEAAPVVLWGRDAALVEKINETRENAKYLPGATIPPNVTATSRLEDLAGSGLVLLVVPSKAFRSLARALSAVGLEDGAVLLSGTKGIEKETGNTMTEILAAEIPGQRYAVLSGPNHAEEVAQHLAAAAVIGCADEDVAVALQDTFTLPWFRTYTSNDVKGIEWAGAVKNVFAIAAGIVDGLGLGDNAKAALTTRGLAEMIRLGVALGGRRETFQGLSGVGDLIATCYSRHSRNNRVGRLLGEGRSLADVTGSMNMVAEGVPNTESIYLASRKAAVRTPIIDMAYAILYHGKPCSEALQDLLNRDPRPEED